MNADITGVKTSQIIPAQSLLGTEKVLGLQQGQSVMISVEALIDKISQELNLNAGLTSGQVTAIANSVVSALPYFKSRRISIADFTNGGINFNHADIAGRTGYEIFYIEGSQFLVPNDHFIYTAPGLSLTGFGAIQAGQTFLLIP